MDRLNNYMEIGVNKVGNTYLRTFISAILSGIFISFASIASIVVSSNITNLSISRLLSGIVFPVGLILVVMFKAELFTGNILLIMPYLDKKITLKQMLRNLILVYFGNLVGSIVITFLSFYSPISIIFAESILKISNTKMSLSFIEGFSLGVMCNILVTSAVFLASTTKDEKAKITLAYFPIFLFIIMGLEHSVANMYYLSIGYLLSDNISINSIFINNLLPVTLGNIIGGIIIGCSTYYLSRCKQ